jgi:hypothetical protein
VLWGKERYIERSYKKALKRQERLLKINNEATPEEYPERHKALQRFFPMQAIHQQSSVQPTATFATHQLQ